MINEAVLNFAIQGFMTVSYEQNLTNILLSYVSLNSNLFCLVIAHGIQTKMQALLRSSNKERKIKRLLHLPAEVRLITLAEISQIYEKTWFD